MSRKLSGLFVFLCIGVSVFSQQSGEIGIHMGGTYYLGELNWNQQFYSTRINYGAFYKQHFNPRIALKLGALYTHVQADDQNSHWEYQNLRNLSFENQITEVSAQVEFNFLIYEVGETKKKYFTPYLNSGIGAIYISDVENDFSLVVPVGVGVKVNLSKHLVFGIEWAFRKTFTDRLDNLTGEDLDIYSQSMVFADDSDDSNMYKQYGFINNDDWYSYAAVSLSYAFKINAFECHAYN